MLNFIKKYIEVDQEKDVKLSPKEKADKIKVAVCALFLEIAYCDDEFSDDEKKRIIEALKSKFSLNEDEVKELLEIAEEELNRSVDLWHFTNLINENYTTDDKLDLLEMLWEIVYADNVLDKHEDYLIHKLSNLLRLDRSQLISAKLKAKSIK